MRAPEKAGNTLQIPLTHFSPPRCCPKKTFRFDSLVRGSQVPLFSDANVPAVFVGFAARDTDLILVVDSDGGSGQFELTIVEE